MPNSQAEGETHWVALRAEAAGIVVAKASQSGTVFDVFAHES